MEEALIFQLDLSKVEEGAPAVETPRSTILTLKSPQSIHGEVGGHQQREETGPRLTSEGWQDSNFGVLWSRESSAASVTGRQGDEMTSLRRAHAPRG